MIATTADSARGAGGLRPARRSSPAADRLFAACAALLFAVCAAATIRWCGTGPHRMPMRGGGALAEMAAVVSVWMVMMVAMMLPSFTPVLLDYRRRLREAHGPRVGTPTMLAGLGYFLAWAGAGMVAYLLGAAATAAATRWPALGPLAPWAGSVALLAAGAIQLTAWKARHLERCRMGLLCGGEPSATRWSACRDGLRYGRHCCLSCAGLVLAMQAPGVMGLAAIAGITGLITLERVARRPDRAARAAGVLLLLAAAAW